MINDKESKDIINKFLYDAVNSCIPFPLWVPLKDLVFVFMTAVKQRIHDS
jgi:hypothetical protein